MRRPERVIGALGAFGEARQASALTQGANAAAPPGQDLVRVGLVTDVPNQPVMRGIEHIMERHGELHHPETGTEVPAGDRHRTDGLAPQLVRKRFEVVDGKPAEILGCLDLVESRRVRLRHELYSFVAEPGRGDSQTSNATLAVSALQSAVRSTNLEQNVLGGRIPAAAPSIPSAGNVISTPTPGSKVLQIERRAIRENRTTARERGTTPFRLAADALRNPANGLA